MELREFILQSDEIIKHLGEEINHSEISLKQAEEKILQHINQLGQIMVDEVMEGVKEPVGENRVVVDEKVAVFDGTRNLRFLNRFGGVTVKPRRCYKYLNHKGGYYPLDEKLGIDGCGGFSPLMTSLQALFGACESFEHSEELLSSSMGFKVSATAIQRNTEATGGRIDDRPYRMIDEKKRHESCELMVVQIDGTMSPQIHEEPGVRGRESLKQPTEYKECNLVIVEKHKGKQRVDRWIGARYGPRKNFEEHVRRTGLQMGQLEAEKIVFIADGAKTNWEIQKTNFPEAVPILDFYHAGEHLGTFCNLMKDPKKGKKRYEGWIKMLLDGEVLQVIAEMKEAKKDTTNRSEAVKEINYYLNNRDRMKYKEYKDNDYSIGSGVVEGACKFVVGKRFKGSGMRWKKADNEKVLKVRLAKLNGLLHDYFVPNPQIWTLVHEESRGIAGYGIATLYRVFLIYPGIATE